MMNDKQKACSHSSWSPVEGEFGAYQCQECEVYGFKLGTRQPGGVLGTVGTIRPWADGKLHSATTAWGKGKCRKTDAPKDLTNLPSPRNSPRPRALGTAFLEPPPEKNHR